MQALTAAAAAWWIGTKALAVINTGRLYRDTHATFDAYVDDVWGISPADAYTRITA
ncbi:hypothetical protein ACWEP8_36245 [Streptomyces hydrogenans]